MGIAGFGMSRADIEGAFGLSAEDKANFEARREAEREVGGTAKALAEKSITPAMEIAKQGITAQMHGASMEDQRGNSTKVQTTRTVTQSRNARSFDDGVAEASDGGYEF